MTAIMCAYGNCQVMLEAGKGFKVTITKSRDGKVIDRQSFCCESHAFLWLQKQTESHEHGH